MTQIILSTIILITSMVFMQMNHPLAMGLMLLIQTTLICLTTGLMAKSFWFSYILFLIFLGGMLVLFIYVTSLASNEMFSLSTSIMMMSTLMLSLTMITLIMMDKTTLYTIIMNNEMMNLMVNESLIKENTPELLKLYNHPTYYMTILMINYLLITLIAIVKITNIFYGPLRPSN